MNTTKYPPSIIDDLNNQFRTDKVKRILQFFDFVIYLININDSRWVNIHSSKIESLLGKTNYKLTLNKLSNYILIDNSYSNSEYKYFTKSFSLSNKLIVELTKYNNFQSLIKYLQGINKVGVPSGTNSNLINSNLINYSSIMFPTCWEDYNNTYTIDYNKLNDIKDELFDNSNYKDELFRQCHIQSVKSNLECILTDNIKTTISEKNGRHYDNITNLQKEIRLCLMKNTESYLGQLDLKCCHGFIVLSIIKELLSPEEHKLVYSLLSNPSLWCYLTDKLNLEDKDNTKSKFQLFMNGIERDNQSNPIYHYFKENHPKFTECLFRLKDDKINLSNEINKIESSVMHDSKLNELLTSLGLNYDIIHDCLWLYGKPDDKVILRVVQTILQMFKDIHNVDMVFTIEIIGKPKVLYPVPVSSTPT